MQNMETFLVFVGLLCLCGLSSMSQVSSLLPPACVREVQENMDFPGTDLVQLFSPDAAHCQLLCTQHPYCLFFTFIRADWTRDNRNFYCYLKSTESGRPNVQTPLLGVTSGYSLKPCSPSPDVCLSQVYNNVDFYGSDYRTLFTADYEGCQRACTSDPGCQFFTFATELFSNEKIRYKCHLKFSWTIPNIPVIESTAGVVSGFSHKMFKAKENQTSCLIKMFPSTDIPGQDFEWLLAASPNHCQHLCSAQPRCTFFSYVSQMFRCYLKNNANEMVMRPKNDVISGLPTRHCQPDNSWVRNSYEGVDFRGSDMRSMETDDDSSVNCQVLCDEDPNCQFYSYVSDSFHDAKYRRHCYLKRGITLPAPPKVNRLANVISGFSLKNC